MVQESPVSPRKEPKQDRARATVQAILEATARILTEDGIDGANTNRIAEVAGVSVGSLYQYFPNKDAIILEVAKEHCNEMLGLLAETVQELGDAPIDLAVRTYVRAMLRAHAVDPALHRVLIHQVMHIGLDHFHEIDAAANALVRAYLVQHADEITPTNHDVAAFLLVTSVEAITHVAALERPELLASKALEDEVVAFVLRYLGVEVA